MPKKQILGGHCEAVGMNRPVRLDQIGWIPRSIRVELTRHQQDFERSEYKETIEGEPWFERVACALEEVAARRDVVAFHCCRQAAPGEIASRGLRVLEGNGDLHRAEFLDRFGHLFTETDREQIRRDFDQVWADGNFSRGRQGKICFALAHPRHWGGGADDLLGIYGGEAIYGTWGRVGPIVDRLRMIGAPAVVQFRINVDAILTWMRKPAAGRTALWAWHRRFRPDVSPYWAEGYMHECVPPERILMVEEWLPPSMRRARRYPSAGRQPPQSKERRPQKASAAEDGLTDEERQRIIDELDERV